MDSLPLSQSGKVDRAKLKSIWSNRRALESTSERGASGEPVTEMQRHVVQAFQEALGLESLGIFDNFFELGGHSLSAIGLQNALSSRGISVTLQEVFRAQTPEQIAEMFDKGAQCPVTEMQQHVVQAFQEALGLESVGIYDNFFELGGNSLAATELQNALSSRGLSVTLQDVYRGQTPEQIAKMFDKGSQEQVWILVILGWVKHAQPPKVDGSLQKKDADGSWLPLDGGLCCNYCGFLTQI